MTIQAMRDVKNSKSFYRNAYRRVIVMLLISLALNILFVYGIYRQFLIRRIPSYFATSGVKPPIQLKPLAEPNYSGQALLAPDPVDEEALVN